MRSGASVGAASTSASAADHRDAGHEHHEALVPGEHRPDLGLLRELGPHAWQRSTVLAQVGVGLADVVRHVLEARQRAFA